MYIFIELIFITCLGPPMFDSVMVCLGVSDVSPDCLAELIVIYSVSWLVITVVEHNNSLLFIVWGGELFVISSILMFFSYVAMSSSN